MNIVDRVKNFIAPLRADENDGLFEEDYVGLETQGTAVQPAMQPMATAVADSEQQVVGGAPVTGFANPAAEAALKRQNLQVVSGGKVQDMRIQIYAPQSFDTVSEIADALKEKRSVIVNYERVEMAEQRRICDFLNGVCYVQNGDVRRITQTMVLYVPDGVEIKDVKSVASDAASVQF